MEHQDKHEYDEELFDEDYDDVLIDIDMEMVDEVLLAIDDYLDQDDAVGILNSNYRRHSLYT